MSGHSLCAAVIARRDFTSQQCYCWCSDSGNTNCSSEPALFDVQRETACHSRASTSHLADVGTAISLLEGDVMDNYVMTITTLTVQNFAQTTGFVGTMSITRGCGSNATTLFSKDVNSELQLAGWVNEETLVPWSRGDEVCVKLGGVRTYLTAPIIYLEVTFVPKQGVPELLTPALSPAAVTQQIAAGNYGGVNTTWGMNGELSSSAQTYAGVITCTDYGWLSFSFKNNEPAFVTVYDFTGSPTSCAFSASANNSLVASLPPVFCAKGKEIFVVSEQASHFSWSFDASTPTAVPTAVPTVAPPTAVPTAAPPTAVPTVAPAPPSPAYFMYRGLLPGTVGPTSHLADVGSAISLLEGDVMDNYVMSIDSLTLQPLDTAAGFIGTMYITQGCGSSATTLFSKVVNREFPPSGYMREELSVPWSRGDEVCVQLGGVRTYLPIFLMYVGVTFVPKPGVPELLTPALSPAAVTQQIAAGNYDGVDRTWGMNGELSSSAQTFAGVITCTGYGWLTFSFKDNEPAFVTIHGYTGTNPSSCAFSASYNNSLLSNLEAFCAKGKEIFVVSEQASHFSWSFDASTPTAVPTVAPPTAVPTVAPTAIPTAAPPTAVPTVAPPTAVPTPAPPTAVPTAAPPTAAPTVAPPTAVPTVAPTAIPTAAPPTAVPTVAPPTAVPTPAPPTAVPTAAPPTAVPTVAPPTAVPASVAQPVRVVHRAEVRVTAGFDGVSAGVGTAISLLEGDVMYNYVVSVARLNILCQKDAFLGTLSITQGCGSNATTLFLLKDVNLVAQDSLSVNVQGVPFNRAAWLRGDELCVKVTGVRTLPIMLNIDVGVTFVPKQDVPELRTLALSPAAVTQQIAAGNYDGVNTTWGMNGELSSSAQTYAGVITCTEDAMLDFSLKDNEPGFVTIHGYTGTVTAFAYNASYNNSLVSSEIPCAKGKQIFVVSEQASHFSWSLSGVTPTAGPGGLFGTPTYVWLLAGSGALLVVVVAGVLIARRRRSGVVSTGEEHLNQEPSALVACDEVQPYNRVNEEMECAA